MKKKPENKKSKKVEAGLSPEEQVEAQMILDRLAVQNPVGESFHKYLESLCSTLEKREDLTVALLDHLSRKPTEVGFQVLQKLGNTVEDRQNRKLVRQFTYRFEQKGFGSIKGEAARETIVLVAKEERKALSHIIPAEGSFGFFAALIPESGHPYPMAVSMYTQGFTDELLVEVTESSYKSYREYIQVMSDKIGRRKPVEVPLWHVAGLFFDLLSFLPRKGAASGLERARRLLRPYHNPGRPSYAHEVMEPVANPSTAIHTIEVDALLEQVAVSWLEFGAEDLVPYRQKLLDLQTSVLLIPGNLREERTRAILKEAANALCTGVRHSFFTRFFEENALAFKLLGIEKTAKDAWIVARHLATDAQPEDNPVVTRMIMLSIQGHWPGDLDTRETPRSSYEAGESGLILPT